MKRSQIRSIQDSANEKPKASYAQPALICYGEIAKLTAGGSKQTAENQLNPRGARND